MGGAAMTPMPGRGMPSGDGGAARRPGGAPPRPRRRAGPRGASSCGECEVEEEDEDEGCVDSTSWYSKKSKYDCDYVAKKPEDRCSLKDDDKVKGKDACPSSCGECEEDVPVPAPVPAPTAAPGDEDEDEDETCADSTSWYWKKSKYDCDYVAKKPEDRCSLKDDYKVKSKDACPSSCGECEEAETCVDSTSWYYKKSKETCSDYVSQKSKNCKGGSRSKPRGLPDDLRRVLGAPTPRHAADGARLDAAAPPPTPPPTDPPTRQDPDPGVVT
ncbi:hypothetical protein JL720_10384 [Aureococcus anophagefferens]|nr:hypothetical protein JL720_10384 [Aureococcus anophagefferens]